MKSSVALVLRLLATNEEFCACTSSYQVQQIASKKLSLTVSLVLRLSNMYACYNYIFTQRISFCMAATVKTLMTLYL